MRKTLALKNGVRKKVTFEHEGLAKKCVQTQWLKMLDLQKRKTIKTTKEKKKQKEFFRIYTLRAIFKMGNYPLTACFSVFFFLIPSFQSTSVRRSGDTNWLLHGGGGSVCYSLSNSPANNLKNSSTFFRIKYLQHTHRSITTWFFSKAAHNNLSKSYIRSVLLENPKFLE